MKIEVKGGIIYSKDTRYTDEKGRVNLTVANEIGNANGFVTPEAFTAEHEGKSFILGKKLKISKEVKAKRRSKFPDKTKLPGTQKANGKYSFSDKEKAEIASTLSHKTEDQRIIEDEKKSVMSQYKDRLDRVKLDIATLSRNYINGYEYRDFECYVVINWKEKTKTFFAVDTDEIIVTRPCEASDMQLRLDMEEKG